ncbi:MAG: thioesterase [Oscillospiraceae bacterium]
MINKWYDGVHYSRPATIQYGDCNPKNLAHLHMMMGLFSENAGDECELLGHGYDYLLAHGQVFLVSRMSARFHRTPACGEKIISTTWLRSIEGTRYNRDYEARLESGELLVSASSSWVLYDPIAHKVLRPEALAYETPTLDPRKADCPECMKIKLPDDFPVIGQRPIYFSDLDCNSHVNNAIYSKIAVDFLPIEYRERNIVDFIINFNKETKLGETLEICGAPTEKGFAMKGLSEGTPHFTCEFSY